MYISLMQHLETLEQKGFEAELKNAWTTYRDYEDLRVYKDFLGINRLVSATVNQYVDHIDFVARSDEEGASMIVLPYVVSNGVRVYSDPPQFVVGYRNPKGFGYVPLSDWKAFMEDACLSDHVVAKVQRLFGMHSPVDYSEVPD